MAKVKNISTTITVIGPRGAGKTTYLAGMAYFPQKRLQDGKWSRFSVKAGTDEDSQRLIKDAKRLLLNGLPFSPSSGINKYFFSISINSWRIKEKIHLQAVDVAGEGLDHIEIANKSSYYRQYLEECFAAKFNCFLIILANWEPPESDFEISRTIDTFKQIVRAQVNQADLKTLRFAVAMNKCERGELWPSRLAPEIDIFNQYLKETTINLKSFLEEFGIPRQNLEFFAMSTFGILDKDDPRPNRRDIIKRPRSKADKEERISSLKSLNQWKPYGMLAPIYWLATGKKLPSSF